MTIRRFAALLSPLLAVLLLPLARGAEDNAVQREITRLEQEVNDAYGANNLPKYFGFYAPDAALIFYNKRQTLAEYRRTWPAAVKTEPVAGVKMSDLVIRVEASGQCAIASYQLLVHTRHPDGRTTDESAFETDVWCTTAGAWKIVHVHYSVTPPK